MTKSTRRRLLVGIGAALVAVVAWCAVQAWLVTNDLLSARDAATDVAASLQAGETEGIEDDVDLVRDHADSAVDRTSGLTWRLLSALPSVGDDADAVARVSRAVNVIAADSLGPLVDAGLDPEDFTPSKGRIPLAPFADSAELLQAAADGFAAAEEELEGVNRMGLLQAVRTPYDDVVAQVTKGARVTTAAAKGAELMPSMLGGEGRRTYLVVFQNTAEARSLGGMPGIVTTLTADQGRLTMGRTMPIRELGTRTTPILPLTEEEQAIWSDQPGVWFQDSVFIPDFPRASELMAARFEDETGQEVDGVLSVDPASMGYVVGAAGGLTVDGIELTGENFVDELVHNTYLRFPEATPEARAAEDAFFAEVASSVFDKALGGGVSAPKLVDALSRGVEEGRILLTSFDEQEQDVLSGTRLAGEMPEEDDPLQVGVYVNDSTGSKMSYFLRYSADIQVRSCRAETVELSGRIVVRSDAPEDAATLPVPITGAGEYGVPRGVTLDTFTFFGPVDGTIGEIEIDGQSTEEDRDTYRGRPTAKVPLWLEPQQELAVTWQMSAPRADVDSLELRMTPAPKSGGRTVQRPVNCG